MTLRRPRHAAGGEEAGNESGGFATGIAPKRKPRQASTSGAAATSLRPFHYVVESLVDSGVSKIDFILSDMPERLEDSLGDGARWGSSFRYHLARDATRPYSRLSVIGIAEDEPVAGAWRPAAFVESGILAATHGIGPYGGRWTGWGIVPVRSCAQIRDDRRSRIVRPPFRAAGRFLQDAALC